MVNDPMPVPASPRPALSMPDMPEEAHVSELPLFVSVSTVLPAFALTAPPGRTVQVPVVAAADGTAPGPRARTAAAVRATALAWVRTGLLPDRAWLRSSQPWTGRGSKVPAMVGPGARLRDSAARRGVVSPVAVCGGARSGRGALGHRSA